MLLLPAHALAACTQVGYDDAQCLAAGAVAAALLAPLYPLLSAVCPPRSRARAQTRRAARRSSLPGAPAGNLTLAYQPVYFQILSAITPPDGAHHPPHDARRSRAARATPPLSAAGAPVPDGSGGAGRGAGGGAAPRRRARMEVASTLDEWDGAGAGNLRTMDGTGAPGGESVETSGLAVHAPRRARRSRVEVAPTVESFSASAALGGGAPPGASAGAPTPAPEGLEDSLLIPRAPGCAVRSHPAGGSGGGGARLVVSGARFGAPRAAPRGAPRAPVGPDPQRPEVSEVTREALGAAPGGGGAPRPPSARSPRRPSLPPVRLAFPTPRGAPPPAPGGAGGETRRTARTLGLPLPPRAPSPPASPCTARVSIPVPLA